jgi:hypothetical protein
VRRATGVGCGAPPGGVQIWTHALPLILQGKRVNGGRWLTALGGVEGERTRVPERGGVLQVVGTGEILVVHCRIGALQDGELSMARATTQPSVQMRTSPFWSAEL